LRRVSQIEITSTRIYAVCDDGTLWWSPCLASGSNVETNDWQPTWYPLLRPPEGNDEVIVEKTLEEQAEALVEAGGRQMIIGKGKK